MGMSPSHFVTRITGFFMRVPSAKQLSHSVLCQIAPGAPWGCAITGRGSTDLICCFKRSGSLSSLDVAFLGFDLQVLVLNVEPQTAVDADVLIGDPGPRED
jgi:hypothetical protein